VKLDPATINVSQGLSAPYRVHPGDVLDVKFKYHPGDNTTATVDTDGRLNLPMTGEIQVSGLLLPELEQVIRERASRYMRDPVVNVTVATSEAKAYIGGEVVDEGFVTLTRPMTVLQAIVERGGFRPGADLSDVVILSHEEGQAVAREIDLEAELEGDPSERTLLAADEIVFVPKTGIAKANQFVDEYINRMMPDFLTRMIRFNPIGP
jgi:polysaccharide export outer membrane protein